MKSSTDEFRVAVQAEERWRALARVILFSCVTLAAALLCVQNSSASAPILYVTQTGSPTGACTSNVQSVAWLNSSANWGSAPGQVGPGTVVHLCGTITTTITVYISGTNGNVITLLCDPSGCDLTQPAGNLIQLNGQSYITIDGSGPGGTIGVMENTANGSGMANQVATQAISGATGSGNIEIRNWLFRNLYVHSSVSDITIDQTSSNIFYSQNLTGPLSIHDNMIHDVGWAIHLEGYTNKPTASIYNNYLYNYDHGVAMAAVTPAQVYLNIYNNHFGTTKNWDTTGDNYHHDGLHFFGGGLGINVYDNLFDGDWGNCCATGFIYTENSIPSNFYVYNNVALQAPGNVFPLFEMQASGGGFMNNTVVCAPGGNNIVGFESYNAGTSGMIIENNVMSGCGTFLEANAGSNYTIDYNTYMAEGSTGNFPFGYAACSGASDSFVHWQSRCGADAHGQYQATSTLNADGTPQVGSPINGMALNLTSLNIHTLDSDKIGILRPSSGSWTGGAFSTGVPGNQPAAPLGLAATVN